MPFSHLSSEHTAFSLDGGSGSITNVRRSPLLRPNVVSFVEGPSQATLPTYRFNGKLQLVMIDGPHAYPFPDLEYYSLYPHLDTGALLILDDIHIRSIRNLFEFLRKDAMFELNEVVGRTAFLTRTKAPAFDPMGDGWWTQNYNSRALLRYAWRERLGRLRPKALRSQFLRFKRDVFRLRAGCTVRILQPHNGAAVGETGEVEGSAALPDEGHLWVLVRRKDSEGWWPQGGGPLCVGQGRWRVTVAYGGPQDAGSDFEIAAVVVRQTTNEFWMEWVSRTKESNSFSPVRLPPARYVFDEDHSTVRKR